MLKKILMILGVFIGVSGVVAESQARNIYVGGNRGGYSNRGYYNRGFYNQGFYNRSYYPYSYYPILPYAVPPVVIIPSYGPGYSVDYEPGYYGYYGGTGAFFGLGSPGLNVGIGIR